MCPQLKRLFTTALFITFTTLLMAVPARPQPFVVQQPDGSFLTIQLFGDENNKIRTTSDGYLIHRNSSGFYVYADSALSREESRIARDPDKRNSSDHIYLARIGKKELASEPFRSPSRVKKIQEEVQSTGFPRFGSPRSLVIMVNFTDKKFVVPEAQQAFSRLLNTEGYAENGSTGSARDYFKASSNGHFSPLFDVVGPYELPNTMAYYGANNSSGDDVKPAYMIADACILADNDINFSDYDLDNDGYIDNVFVYYAGHNEAEGAGEHTIWPHRWAVYSGNYTGNSLFDGKRLFDYACTSELRSNTGSSMCGIGTFTHEFGHVIGLPDHYHTTSPAKNTLNNWSIMDSGAYLNSGRTPPAYSAYDRFYLGWLIPEELYSPDKKTLFPLSQAHEPLTTSSGQAYLLSAERHNLNGALPFPREFFVLEYRKKTGWDRYLPAEGMLIWHIDYDQNAWDQNTPNNYTGSSQTASSHMRIYLQPLIGNSTTPGTAFTSGSFNPVKWNGTSLNRPVSNITLTSDSINFSIMGGPAGSSTRIIMGEVSSMLHFGSVVTGKHTEKQLNFKTSAFNGNMLLSLTGEGASQFTLSTQKIPATDSESVTGTIISISYKPTQSGSHQATLIIDSNGEMPVRIITLQGEAVENNL